MEGVVADLMSIHPMEGYVVVVTQLGSVVLPSSEDVHHHRGQQAYGPSLQQHSQGPCWRCENNTDIQLVTNNKCIVLSCIMTILLQSS